MLAKLVGFVLLLGVVVLTAWWYNPAIIMVNQQPALPVFSIHGIPSPSSFGSTKEKEQGQEGKEARRREESASGIKISPIEKMDNRRSKMEEKDEEELKTDVPLSVLQKEENHISGSSVSLPPLQPAAMLELPSSIQFPASANCTSLIIEVGTNVQPDYLPYTKLTPGVCLLCIEPIEYSQARFNCEKAIGNRCLVLPVAIGLHEEIKAMSVPKHSKCSSLVSMELDPKHNLTKGGCHTIVRRQLVKVITLDALLSRIYPSLLPIFILCLDMQGFDVHGLLSLKNETLRRRIAHFIFECQDLPAGDKRWLNPKGGSYNCGEGLDCVLAQWKFLLNGCWRNMWPGELNCVVRNPKHHLSRRGVKPTFIGRPRDRISFREKHAYNTIQVRGKCPESEKGG